MRRCRRLAILTLWLCLAAWPALAAELTVSAAASLTNVFGELKPLFEKAHPGQTLTFNFAASGPLLKQIAEGAPVDVFASADQETMDAAAAKGLIATATRRNFTANELVLIAPSDSKIPLRTPADLAAAPIQRIAIGNPDSVPAGRYARDALGGLYAGLSPKFVLAASVRQVLDYVRRAEVQAGFVYRTDAMVAKDAVRVVMTMSGHAPILYPAAVVAASPHKNEAALFVGFLLSPEAKAVLARHGFAKP